MTPKEKLFFKVFSVKKKQNAQEHSYIVLFDVLNSMETYDEAALQKNFKKLGFIYNTDTAKSYLTKALLKSLTEYHSDSSAERKIQDLILQAEILYKKNLKKLADPILEKAEKLSLEFEKYEYLLMISSLKANLAVDLVDIEDLKELTDKGIQEQLNYRRLYDNTMDYRNLLVEIGSLYNQSPEVTSEDRSVDTRLKELFNHPLLKDSKTALTFSAKQYFYKLHYQHIRYVNKWGGEGDEKSSKMLGEWVAYLENQEDLRNNYPEVYLNALAYSIVGSVSKGGQSESDAIYKKGHNFFNSLSKKNMDYIVERAFMNMFVHYTDVQLKLLNPEKCVEAFDGASRHTFFLPVYMNMSLAYFLLGRYNEALSCVNKIVNEKGHYRMDLQAMSKLYVLMIHYELRNIDLLPYIAHSSERWLIKNKYPLGSFDKALIRFFRYKLPKMDSIEEERQEFSRLLTQLKEDEKSGGAILSREEFYLRPWLESKIQNRPLMDIAREKTAKKT